MAKVLVVDDETSIRETLLGILERQGYDAAAAAGLSAAKRLLAGGEPPDVALVDLRLADGDGTSLLAWIRERDLPTSVVMISGHGSIPAAVEAVKQGAFDFLEKPLDRDRLLITVRNAARQAELAHKVRSAKGGEDFLAASPAMKALLAEAGKLAPADAPLLITGETGAGKEVLARWIHSKSKRREGPFVALNCAALPESLAESELFGHARGAFTGAESARKGKFQVAAGGTLFLDEIGDLSLPVQAKLLRVLEDGLVEPVGSDRPVPVDVRVLAASHRDLGDRVRQGQFREDLLFRIGGLPLRIPSLRERPEEIGLMARRFLDETRARQGWAPEEPPEAFFRRLQAHSWPGNVRELRWAVERAALLAGPACPGPEHISPLGGGEKPVPAGTRRLALDEAEARAIREALQLFGGNVTRAAARLSLSRSRLYDRLKELGIDPEEFREEG